MDGEIDVALMLYRRREYGQLYEVVQWLADVTHALNERLDEHTAHHVLKKVVRPFR